MAALRRILMEGAKTYLYDVDDEEEDKEDFLGHIMDIMVADSENLGEEEAAFLRGILVENKDNLIGEERDLLRRMLVKRARTSYG